jgi:hypothetical protein
MSVVPPLVAWPPIFGNNPASQGQQIGSSILQRMPDNNILT